MADEIEVQMIIKALTEGFDKLGDDIGGLGKAADTATPKVQKTDLSLTDLKSGIDLATEAAKIVGGVFRQAFDLAEEGAQLKDTTDSLTRLAQQSGYAGDLIETLEKSAGGTVDDLDYMGSTIRLLTGETGTFAKSLATAAPQLLTMARAAVKLNPTLGDTAEAYEAITKAIETGQVRALKDYGIVIDATGTKEERLQEILAVMPGLMEQVGGSVETSTDSINRLKQMVDNARDSLSLFLADGLLPIADGALAVKDAIDQQKQAAVNSNMTFEEYAVTMGALKPIVEAFNLVTGGAAEANLAHAQAAVEDANEVERLMAVTEAHNPVIVQAGASTIEWANNSFYAQQAQLALRDATVANKEAAEEAQQAAENIAGAFKNVGLAAYDAQVWTTLLAVASGQMSGEAAQAALNSLDLQKAVADGAVSMGTYFAIMKDGVITQEEFDTAMGNTTAAQEEQTEAAFLSEQQNRKFVDSEQAVIDKTPELITQMNDLAETADLAAGDRYIKFHISTSGTIPHEATGTGSGGNAGGGYDTGGIIPGNSGQAVAIVAHAREMVLNDEQQSNLFALLNNGGGLGGSVIQIVLDGQVIAESINPYLGSLTRQARANGAGRY